MVPVYKPGDHVLTFNWGRIKVGEVVTFVHKGKFMIKKVDKVLPLHIEVSGFNSQESANVGPIKISQVVGKVILKY